MSNRHRVFRLEPAPPRPGPRALAAALALALGGVLCAPAMSSVGGLQGTATLEGAAPERRPLQMAADPKCSQMHGGKPVLSEEVMVDAEGGLANVFVYVKNPPPGPYPAPATPVKLEQHGCLYTPRVQGILLEQKLEIVNGDDTLHNVRALAEKNRPFNLGQPPATAPRIKTFTVTEPALKFRCDVHPWMSAYLFVIDHPYFGTSAADGSFAIPALPAGTYTLVAWHEKLGEQEAQVTVGADGAATAAFTFEAQAGTGAQQ